RCGSTAPAGSPRTPSTCAGCSTCWGTSRRTASCTCSSSASSPCATCRSSRTCTSAAYSVQRGSPPGSSPTRRPPSGCSRRPGPTTSPPSRKVRDVKIGFVVNAVSTEQPVYTTTRLAMAAANLGHDAWLLGMGDFGYEPDGTLIARARAGADKGYRSLERYLEDVQKPETDEQVALDEFDVVMLRADPADET